MFIYESEESLCNVCLYTLTEWWVEPYDFSGAFAFPLFLRGSVCECFVVAGYSQGVVVDVGRRAK